MEVASLAVLLLFIAAVLGGGALVIAAMLGGVRDVRLDVGRSQESVPARPPPKRVADTREPAKKDFLTRVGDATGLAREGQMLVGRYQGRVVRVGQPLGVSQDDMGFAAGNRGPFVLQMDGAPIGISLARRGYTSLYRPSSSTPLGDDGFDGVVWAGGQRARVLAALDHERRGEVADLIRRRGMVLAAGQIHWVKNAASSLSVERVVELLDDMARLADLVHVDDVRGALEARALQDPVPEVRRRATEELEDLDAIARPLLNDPEAVVRLSAARRLQHVDTLVELAFESGVDPRLRREAFQVLVDLERVSPEVVVAALGVEPLRGLAVDVAAHTDDDALRMALVEVAGHVDDPARARAVLDALVPLGAAAQDGLIALLERRGARLGAAERLGEVGDERAMPALRKAAEGGLFANAAVVQAAQTAMEAIRARNADAAGGLAVVGEEGGELSIAHRRRGALSRTE